MFKHAVMWKLKDNSGDGADRIKNGLYALRPIIPEIRNMTVYKDIKHTPASYDLLLLAEFENESDYLVYADHPEHVKVKKLIGELTEDRVILDCDD